MIFAAYLHVGCTADPAARLTAMRPTASALVLSWGTMVEPRGLEAANPGLANIAHVIGQDPCLTLYGGVHLGGSQPWLPILATGRLEVDRSGPAWQPGACSSVCGCRPMSGLAGVLGCMNGCTSGPPPSVRSPLVGGVLRGSGLRDELDCPRSPRRDQLRLGLAIGTERAGRGCPAASRSFRVSVWPRSTAVTIASAIQVRASRWGSSGVALMIAKYSVGTVGVVGFLRAPGCHVWSGSADRHGGAYNHVCPLVTAYGLSIWPVDGPPERRRASHQVRSPRVTTEITVVPMPRPTSSMSIPTPYRPVTSWGAASAVQAAVKARVSAAEAGTGRTPANNPATNSASSDNAQPTTCHASYGPLHTPVRGSCWY